MAVTLPDADEETVQKVKHDWKVTHRLSLGVQRNNGRVGRATEVIFKKGDFVEVLVYADVVTYINAEDGKLHADIQYAPQELIRLRPAAEARVRYS